MVRIDPGECIQTTLEKFVAEEGGNALVLTAIGSVSKLVVALPKLAPDKKNVEVMNKELEGTFEITSLIGGVGPAYRLTPIKGRAVISIWPYSTTTDLS
jgi:predicted DNA-binding protein with PD1-like motif